MYVMSCHVTSRHVTSLCCDGSQKQGHGGRQDDEHQLAFMRHVVQMLQQPEVRGEEDVCSAFGYQIAGMVSGVPSHLSDKHVVRLYLMLIAVVTLSWYNGKVLEVTE